MKRIRLKKRLISLRSRYSIPIIILTVFVLTLTVAQVILMDDIFTYSAKRDMIKAAEEVERLQPDSENFLSAITNCETSYNVYIEIYRPKDVLIYTTDNNNYVFEPSAQGETKDELKPRIMKILDHKDVDDTSFFETRQEYFASAEYIVYSKDAPNNTSIVLYSSVESIIANAKTASWSLFSVSVLLLSLVAGLIILYAFTFVIPIDRINTVTKKMACMQFDERCPGFKIRELDELSSSVNALSFSLDATLKDLNTKNKRLEQDIEKERKLEEMRKQFISDASHELKTPISIIQGYAEALKCGITDDSPDEYCDVIIEEAQKMNSLVMRLLEMTRYDHPGYTLKCTGFNIAELFQEYISSREKVMKKNDIDYKADIDTSFMGYGDKELIETVFGNYISNAVSHAEFEKQIRVTCKAVGDSYRVSVFNTGKPIADEDIENIWQSFYRADKSRSRAQGRFGLGLSIAAAAQQLHGQDYGVINHKDGVEFWFDISRYVTGGTAGGQAG